jgi:hypothetical protein
MSVRVYFVSVVSCVQVATLRQADPPSKEFYRLCTDSSSSYTPVAPPTWSTGHP